MHRNRMKRKNYSAVGKNKTTWRRQYNQMMKARNAWSLHRLHPQYGVESIERQKVLSHGDPKGFAIKTKTWTYLTRGGCNDFHVRYTWVVTCASRVYWLLFEWGHMLLSQLTTRSGQSSFQRSVPLALCTTTGAMSDNFPLHVLSSLRLNVLCSNSLPATPLEEGTTARKISFRQSHFID